MTDLVRVEVDSPTVTFDDSLGKAQPLNPPNVAILLEYLSARFPCGTCTFPASPRDDFRLQNSPKTPRRARIRTVTHTTPPPPGGVPRKTRPRQVLAASIKASQLFTRRPNSFEHSSPIQHQNLAQRPLPHSGDRRKIAFVYQPLICSRRATMTGGQMAANNTNEQAPG